MLTPTFKTVAAESFDLTDITPMRDVSGVPTAFANTLPTSMCNGAISIVKISSEGNYISAYYYFCTKAKNGWYAGTSSTTPVEKGTVSFLKGEAMLINNTLSSGKANAFFAVSGEVDFDCNNVIPAKYSLYGNSTPVAIDLSKVVLYRIVNGEKTAFASTLPTTMCNGAISVVKISADGNYGSAYYYFCTKAKNGWHAGTSSTTAIAEGDFTLEPGESVLVNNTYSGGAVIMELPTPVAK